MRAGFIQKRCPRCNGNIYLDSDLVGWYEKCLQCSYTRYLETIVEAREKVSRGSLGQARGSTRVDN